AAAYRIGGRVSQQIGALQSAAVTERRRADAQFQTLVESAPNGVIAVDADGRIVLVNAQTERMFGYARAELVGQPVECLIPPRLRSGHAVLRQGFVASPHARPMGTGCELFGQRKDGGEFPIEIGLNPIETAAGALVLASMADISERKQAEERISAALDALCDSEEQR